MPAKTHEEIHVVFTSRVAIGIEVTTGVVAAREDGKPNFGHCIIFCGTGLGPSEWTLVVGPAHIELIVVSLERSQILRFNLSQVNSMHSKAILAKLP
jgi:hypothetical protein